MPPPVSGPNAAPRRAISATPAVDPSQPAPPLTVDPDAFDGAKVKKAEQYMRKLGLHPGVVDRQYTANTERAVKTFQSAAGLDPTGALDVRTMNAMRQAAKRKDDGVQSAGQQSDNIKTQERRLKRLGYDVGIVDGLYDQKTAKAVEAFKKDQRVDVNGMLGKRGRELIADENRGSITSRAGFVDVRRQDASASIVASQRLQRASTQTGASASVEAATARASRSCKGT